MKLSPATRASDGPWHDWGHGPAQAVGRLQHPLDPEDLDEEQDERTVQGVAPVNHDASFY